MRSGVSGDDEDNSLAPALTTRRALLGGIAAASCLAPLPARAQAQNPGAKLRPQPGDQLVFAAGERAGQVVAASDVAAGAEPVVAWPRDAASGLLRDGSRLNQVRLVRLDASALSPRTAPHAAEGIVAFAAMCSHAGCDVSGWVAETRELVCPCHGSTFRAEDAAAVAKGPATKPLALLPLRIENGELRVARGFTRKVGFTPV
jgi:Rieske Fe-S protein